MRSSLTVTCKVFCVNRRALTPIATLTALGALAPALSGCQAVDSIVDYFGPRPDEALVGLGRSADADAQQLAAVDPHASQLRSEQADALYAEVERLCGRNEEGTAPHSCEVQRDPQAADQESAAENIDVIEVMDQAAVHTRDALSEVSAESRALVTNQAIILDAWEPSQLPESSELDPSEADRARELLEWEYEQVYGLDFARTYAVPSMEENIDDRLEMHEKRIAALQKALAPLGEVPQPAPAYEPTPEEMPLPSDAASAQAFVDHLGWNDSLEWSSVASQAAAPTAEGEERVAWRNWLIAVAAQSRGL